MDWPRYRFIDIRIITIPIFEVNVHQMAFDFPLFEVTYEMWPSVHHYDYSCVFAGCTKRQCGGLGPSEDWPISGGGDGKLASCGDDGAIMLWDLNTGEHLQTLRRDRPYERLNITGIWRLTEAQKATLREVLWDEL